MKWMHGGNTPLQPSLRQCTWNAISAEVQRFSAYRNDWLWELSADVIKVCAERREKNETRVGVGINTTAYYITIVYAYTAVQ